uniref:Uncharacterized protein n=1 Tax=Mastacembelus armatus TaxID=205130 RepID=A0A3Q3L2M5_9TELE
MFLDPIRIKNISISAVSIQHHSSFLSHLFPLLPGRLQSSFFYPTEYFGWAFRGQKAFLQETGKPCRSDLLQHGTVQARALVQMCLLHLHHDACVLTAPVHR